MAIDDPKTRVRPAPDPEPAEPTMAQVLARMTDLLAAVRTGGATDANMKQVELMERLLIKTQPENPQATGISAFFTEADKAQYGEKPTLRCKTVWAGREVFGDVETPEEILLLNRLEHGDYKVTKSDGNRIKFEVRLKRDDNDRLSEVNVWFPCKGEHKHNHGSMVSYCRQALGEAIPTASELMAEVARLRAELASAMVGVTQG